MQPSPDELRDAVRLHMAPLTPRQREALLERAGGLGSLARLDAGDGLDALLAVSARDVEAELERCERRGIRIVTSSEPRWPPLLSQIHDPPRALWIRGELPSPDAPCFAVVGPRRPTPYGIAVASRLASDLAMRGGVIVSGGARGIDSEAHRAALRAGSPTVALLGCGVDVDYPRENRELFDAIARCGTVVSEHPCGTPPLQHHFPIRNRLLAGWAKAVLVVEATLRSGSLITAHLALQQNREVLAVPGPITSEASEGTNELIAQGAKLLRTAQDAVDELPPEDRARLTPAEQPDPAAGIGPDPVLDALPAGIVRTVDELHERTGLDVPRLLARLGAMESEGRIRCLDGGLWMAVPGARR